MNASSIIIIFLILAMVSLILVNFVNQRETRKRVVNGRIRLLRQRITELEEIVTAIEPLIENLIVLKRINDEIIYIADTILRLDPNALYVNPTKEATLLGSQSFENGNRLTPLNRALSSDSAIAKHQYYLKEAAIIVRKQHATGKLETDLLDTYIHELTWTNLIVEVISIIAQGHIAMDRGNPLQAHSYYKRAHQVLSETRTPDPRRSIFIKELDELLTHKRKTLSSSIMSEVHLNPK